MRLRVVFLVLLTLPICSCLDAQHETVSEVPEEVEYELQIGFTEDEEKALDALDQIQISGWHLYSTFPNLEHECYGDKNSFKISQEHFEDALLYLLNLFYLDLTEEDRRKLASEASKAQEQYTVTTCVPFESLTLEESSDPPRTGMWIFQSLLDQRDLVIKW